MSFIIKAGSWFEKRKPLKGELDLNNLIKDVNTGEIQTATVGNALTFDRDSDTFLDGGTYSFTLASTGNLNGVGKIVRINTPTSISFSSDFIADPNSADIDTIKLNMITFVYFENWNGSNVPKVIYSNTVFDAV